MALGTDRTPIDRFFVCNVDAAPSIAPDEWELTIGGDAVEGVVTVGLDQLTALPQHEVESWLECAGNGRRLFELVDGHVPSGAEADTQWTLGAMGMANTDKGTAGGFIDQRSNSIRTWISSAIHPQISFRITSPTSNSSFTTSGLSIDLGGTAPADATTIVVAAASSAANPRLGVRCVIF